MTPEKQQTAIAIACEWTAEQDSNGYWRATNQKSGDASELWLSERNVWSQGIPDYLNDRNAMHDAIITKFVTIELQQKFAMQLKSLVKKALPFASRSWSDWDLITAALPQLSEAFLRVMGLWEDAQ